MSTQSSVNAPDGLPIRMTVLRNSAGMDVTFMDYGATWLSARVPLADGSVRETLLGCATPQDYLHQSAYLGACVGRYANRIRNATLKRTGNTLSANTPPHQLHGGPVGFSHRRWLIVRQTPNEVVYRLHSPDGDQGFPGAMTVEVSYQLTEDNSLEIRYQAETDTLCPVALTNHAYFNLDAYQGDARQHRLQLAADRYLPVTAEGIPDGDLKDVTGTGFDFREPKTVATDFLRDSDQQKVHGYDHAFLLTGADDGRHPVARLWSADQRLQLSVFTDSPVIQFYTANFLQGTPARQGSYQNHQGIALETGYFPDSPNHPEWPQPDCWLAPGEIRRSMTRYQFSAQAE